MKSRTYILSLVCVAVFASQFGCGSSSNGPAPGRARVVHAVPELSTQPFDVQVNGNTAVRNVGYDQISPSFEAPAGTDTFNVLNAGTTTSVLSNQSVAITTSIDQLILVSGRPSVAAGDQRLRVVNLGRVNLDSSSIPLNGQTRVYFVNAMPESPAGGVDFSITQTPAPTLSPASLAGITYPNISAEQILSFGSTTFSVNVAGANVSASPFTLIGQKVYVVVLSGKPSVSGNFPGPSLTVFQLN